MKGSILFLSKHGAAASTRYRALQYFPDLQRLGWRCSYHAANNNGVRDKLNLLEKCASHDIVVIQRKLLDPLTFSLVKRASKNLVFDYDDAIFLNSDGSPSSGRRRRFNRITQQCDVALAGNRYLAGESLCDNTRVFPTSVVMAAYPGVKTHSALPTGALTLVWIGSQSTRKYLEQHRATFEAIGKQFEAVTLKVISDFEIEFKHLETQCVAWSADSEIPELVSADVGIAPMEDDPWTRGKCGLKLIQYMACGLPVISSNSGANRDIVAAGATGFLAESAEQWINAIEQLQDLELRQRMGAAGRSRVEQYYSAEALANTLSAQFSRLLNHQGDD